MSEWKAKRFWKEASVADTEGGFGIFLDGRPVKTPTKVQLVVPSLSMANAIAREWDAQEEEINPNNMPVTRCANAAIDKVTAQFDEVAQMLAEYGGSDLLCYRASEPQELIDRQAQAWDPILDWSARELAAPLTTANGVMHVAQPEESIKALAQRVHALSAFELAAFHDLVALTGSLVLAFSVTSGQLSPEEAWATSRIDELWQIEQWGEDEEAQEAMELKFQSFLLAARIFQYLQEK